MIFGWLSNGRTDRWVLVDPLFPHPALHDGRNTLRLWADFQNKTRIEERSAGPRRMPWACQTAVKHSGNAELRIWPCEPYGHPRTWTEADRVWREPIAELAAAVAARIACDVEVTWNDASGVIERATSSPDLVGRAFLGWGKGERAPKDKVIERPLADGQVGKVNFRAADLNILSQDDQNWH